MSRPVPPADDDSVPKGAAPVRSVSGIVTLEAEDADHSDRPAQPRAHGHVIVHDHQVTGFRFLFGGTGLAIVVDAAERIAQRPTRWATVQYAGRAALGDRLDLEVRLDAAGSRVAQARVAVDLGGRTILNGLAACGGGDVEPPHTGLAHSGDFDPEMPDAPSPERSMPRLNPWADQESFLDRLEQRVAAGPPSPVLEAHGEVGASEPGQLLIWQRVRAEDGSEGGPATSVDLALMGDILAFAQRAWVDADTGGSSLDNTVRLVRAPQTDWILCQARLESIAEGIGHGNVHFWDQEGTFVGSASQTWILRHRPVGDASARGARG